MSGSRALLVVGIAGGLLGAVGARARGDTCLERGVAQSLRADLRSEAARAVLVDLEQQAETETETAAVRLDRAAVLLDLWNVPAARVEIDAASTLLATVSPPQPSPCGAAELEEPIRVLELLARASRIAGDFAVAAKKAHEALARRRAQAGLQPMRFAEALSLAADASWMAGDIDEMERLYGEATKVAASLDPPDDLLLARVEMGNGQVAAERGEVARAEAAFHRSLDIYRRAVGDAHAALAGLWLSIGALAGNRYDLLNANAAYQQAAAILEPLTDLSLASDRATLSFNLGLMDARLGRIDEARAKIERAGRIWTDTVGPDHPHLAWVKEALSDLLVETGRLEEADAALAAAADVRRRTMPGSPLALLTVARLAALRARQGRTAELDLLSQEIQQGTALRPSTEGYFRAWLATRRSATAEATGDLREAARLRAEAETLLQQQLPAGHPGLAEVRGDRARLAWLLGERRRALRLATNAWQIRRRVVGQTISTLPESDALRFVERSRALRDLLLCAAAAAPTGALSPSVTDTLMRELAASRALISNARPARDETLGDEALAGAKRRYASLLWRPVSSARSDYVEELDRARRRLESLERASTRRTEPQPGRRTLEPEPEAWATLGPRDALVAFARYRCPANDRGPENTKSEATGYVAFVRRGGEAARIVRFPDGAALDRAVGEWYAAITAAVHAPATDSQDEDVRTRGRVLAKVLWSPLAAAVGGADRVFIVPDGALHSVSWYALPAGRGFLVDTRRLFHVLTAESDLRRARDTDPSSARDVVVLADPLVARASTAAADAALGAEIRQLRSACRFVDPRRLPRLEQAVDEARDVEAHAQAAGRKVRLVTGASASESWLRSHAPGAGILHLVAHGGELAPESCRETTEPDADAARVRSLWAEAVRARPLMRSGLLLSGAAGYTPLDAPGTDDDGILVAEEAARLDLRGADWVVLSACSTRRGPVVDAEGALGLHRAFHSAGARTVIASLWDVQDAPARRFMSALYAARLRDGKSTAEAMRDAQRAVLNELRASGRSTHPVQWAAFVASGDWR